MVKKKKISWVCHECGVKHGTRNPIGSRAATYHEDTCDMCGKENVYVTEPRDYGVPREING